MLIYDVIRTPQACQSDRSEQIIDRECSEQRWWSISVFEKKARLVPSETDLDGSEGGKRGPSGERWGGGVAMWAETIRL